MAPVKLKRHDHGDLTLACIEEFCVGTISAGGEAKVGSEARVINGWKKLRICYLY